MIRAIRERVVPELRRVGFKGSFPHFHREAKGGRDLLMFQFNKHGGGFWGEAGFWTADSDSASADVRGYSLPPEMRRRVGYRRLGYMDPEFRFEKRS